MKLKFTKYQDNNGKYLYHLKSDDDQIDEFVSKNLGEYLHQLRTKIMFENMQYYMEYCEANGYITPQNWLEKEKHF